MRRTVKSVVGTIQNVDAVVLSKTMVHSVFEFRWSELRFVRRTVGTLGS